ncbi:phage tail protein [Escherichia sp. E4930]|nr:phage tail protein [Escherichia sp. E4930]TLU80175.1 phage tail protein [Escherichia sp. E4930]
MQGHAVAGYCTVLLNDEIYQCQREMKDELNNLEDLRLIRKLVISSEKL